MGPTTVATDRPILRAGLRLLAVVALVLTAGAGLPLVPGAVAGASGEPNPAYDLDQCANGAVGGNEEQCTGAQWVNGNLNHTKAHYNEGESVPYRARFSNLDTSTSHTVLLEWDTTDTADGLHALDYLTSYDRTETDALACSGVASCSESSFSTYPIPADTAMQAQPDWTANGGVQVPGVFTLFGGTITGASAYTFTGSWAGHSATGIAVTFTTAVSDPVLAWGGHIATRQDWGMDHSAVSISGSPFHMRLLSLDGSGGNQDRSLSNEAVIFPASITIVKDALPNSSTVFPFTASPAPLPAALTLVDDGDAGAPVASVTYTGIETFGTYTVTEGVVPVWSLTGLSCADPTGGTSTSVESRTATIALAEADIVTCTFTNTASAATISVLKTATPSTLPEPGGPVAFDVVVTNESSVLSVTIDSLVDSVYGNLDGVGTCDVPQTVAPLGSYGCSFTATVSGDAGDVETDVVTASGEDAGGNPVSDSDDATVTLTDVLPAIQVVKAASPTLLHAGESVTYTYVVTNLGVEPLGDVTLTDDRCSSVTYVSGDTNEDELLDVEETWTFRCVTTLSTSTLNTALVTGEDDEGNTASDTDTASVIVISPALSIVKTASPTALVVGDTVTYTYVVTNTGDVLLGSVVVSDDRCSPVTFVGGDTDGDAALDLTETWTYRCTTVATAAGTLTNVGTVSGTDVLGKKVTATDTETIQVTAVLPAVIERGLPRTGIDADRMVATGLGLVGTGLLLVLGTHRRRVTAS